MDKHRRAKGSARQGKLRFETELPLACSHHEARFDCDGRNSLDKRTTRMKILMVLTSHDKLGDTGKKTGFWLEEFAAPYYVLKDAGHEITLASPAGGQPPLDPKSDEPDAQTDATKRFKDDEEAQAHLASTHKLADIDVSKFDGVFYPGGHGPLWDLAESADSKAIIEGAL